MPCAPVPSSSAVDLTPTRASSFLSWGVRRRVWGSGFRNEDLGYRVCGGGWRVDVTGFRVYGFRLRI